MSKLPQKNKKIKGDSSIGLFEKNKVHLAIKTDLDNLIESLMAIIADSCLADAARPYQSTNQTTQARGHHG